MNKIINEINRVLKTDHYMVCMSDPSASWRLINLKSCPSSRIQIITNYHPLSNRKVLIHVMDNAEQSIYILTEQDNIDDLDRWMQTNIFISEKNNFHCSEKISYSLVVEPEKKKPDSTKHQKALNDIKEILEANDIQLNIHVKEGESSPIISLAYQGELIVDSKPCSELTMFDPTQCSNYANYHLVNKD